MPSLYFPSISTAPTVPLVKRNAILWPECVGFPRGLGLGLPHQDALHPGKTARLLRARFYFTWLFEHGALRRTIKTAQMADGRFVPHVWALRRDPEMERALTWVKRYPKRFWFLGNEQSRRDQAWTPAAVAAEGSRYWAGQTTVDGVRLAPFAAPGESYDDEGIAWTRAWLDAGAARPDAWLFHLYGASDPRHWRQKLDPLIAFIDGLEARMGWPVLPLILNESNGWGASMAGQVDVLAAMQLALDEVERLAAIFWFSVRNAGMPPSYQWPWTWLIGADGNRTQLGRAYVANQRRVAARSSRVFRAD